MYTIDTLLSTAYSLPMTKDNVVTTRVDDPLYAFLKEVAKAERFADGKISVVIRVALEEFRDRRHPHARRPEPESPDPSS